MQATADPDDDVHAGPRPHGMANRLPRQVPCGEPQPLVSVVLPVYNAEAYLPDCLRGILLQTHRPLELSVCNNNSTDGSSAILKSWAPRLQAAGIAGRVVTTGDDDGQGCGLGRNRAIANATGAPGLLLCLRCEPPASAACVSACPASRVCLARASYCSPDRRALKLHCLSRYCQSTCSHESFIIYTQQPQAC